MNIIFCGCTNNYPDAFSANNTKFGLLSKGLVENSDVNVTILNECFFANSPSEKDDDIVHDGIRVITFRNIGHRNLWKIINFFRTFKLLLTQRTAESVLIISCGNFTPRFFYILFGKMCGYKVGYVFHEYHRGFEHGVFEKMWAYLKDTLFPKMCDFTLPISEFLVKESLKYNKNYFKLPIIADFEKRLTSTYLPSTKPYFCYCASAGYFDAVKLIVDSFSLLNHESMLCMVLTGSSHQKRKVYDYLDNKGLTSQVVIVSNLSDEDLFSCFSNALGLLIPLNPNKITDIARFSQKIAEYLSSKAPVISTNVGEIPYYFHNQKDMLVADFTESSLVKAMEFCINNPELSKQIGREGYSLGLMHFSHKVVASEMVKYLKTLFII